MATRNETDPTAPIDYAGPFLDALPANGPPPPPPPPPPLLNPPPPLPPPPLPHVAPPRGPFGLVRRVVRGVGSLLEWLFGAFVLMVGLATLAAFPLLQFLSLGYLLEAGSRVTRSGRIRDAF